MNPGSPRHLIPGPVRGFLARLLEGVRISVGVLRPRPEYLGGEGRYGYQKRLIDFNIEPGQSVLDIGSGDSPFPLATVLADRFPGPTKHRSGPLEKDDRPFVAADVCDMPFDDKSFDFVYCSHVLEHVDDPIMACREMVRVGKRGYIETPTFGKDAVCSWAGGRHKWHVVAVRSTLCFFEYAPRQLEGIRSPAFREIVMGKWRHPLQEAFYANQEVLNVMFEWEDTFSVFVFRLDGSARALNAGVELL